MRAANAVINAMAAHGPRMFYSEVYERTGKLGLDKQGSVWYVDCRTGMKLYPFDPFPAKGFTDTKDAHALVQNLARFIDTGAQVPFSHFSHDWGYGEAWEAVKKEVVKTKAVKKEPKDGKTEQCSADAEAAA